MTFLDNPGAARRTNTLLRWGPLLAILLPALLLLVPAAIRASDHADPLAPVDGSYTLDLEGMVEVLRAFKAPLTIPMHYFGTYTLNRFLERMRQEWDVDMAETPSLVLSKTNLPVKPKVLVLPGY